AEAFEFDWVTARRFHPGSEYVSGVAAAGSLTADQEGHRPAMPLLVQAQESWSLVLVSGNDGGDVTSSFALPLVSGDRCLAFLCGNRRGTVSSNEEGALATTGN